MEPQVNAARTARRRASGAGAEKNAMTGILEKLFATARHETDTHRLYNAIVEQARNPIFFAELGVPDTTAGRFALVALHAFLAMDRFGRATGQGKASQALFDEMFADMDRNLREMGVGDLSVGRRVKALAAHFLAMAAALRDGLNRGDGVLDAAVGDYVYGGTAPSPESVKSICAYLRACVAVLEGQADDDLARGRIRFAEPEEGSGR